MAKKYIDAEKLIEKFEKMIDNIPASVDSGAGYVIDEVYKIIDSLQQEQQEVDLEKELKNERTKLWDAFGPMNGEQSLAIRNFARHFYEFGKNARKEE